MSGNPRVPRTPTISRKGTRGGARVGSGRPKGSKPKGPTSVAEKKAAIEAQIELAEYTGLTPLEFMLNVMRDHKLHVNTRLQAARDAAPYVHARLQTVTLKGDPANPLATTELTPAQYRDIVVDALKKI